MSSEMELHGIFSRNAVAKNEKVLIAERDIKGRSIADTLDSLIGQAGKVVLEVDNITALNDAQCDELKCADQVVKRTGDQKHAYIVTYKENNVGLCMTYTDASVSETVSYDYTNGHWVYNSTDVTELSGGGSSIEINPDGEITDDLKSLDVAGTIYGVNGLNYLTTAPSSANTSGILKFVVLSSEPSTYYDGYYYIITESAT